MPFGRFRIIKLKSPMPEGNMSWVELPNDSLFHRPAKLVFLLKANFSLFYIECIRKLTNNPQYIGVLSFLERCFYRLRFADISRRHPCKTTTIIPNIIDKNFIDEFRRETFNNEKFVTPYDSSQQFKNIDTAETASIWVGAEDILKCDNFFEIILNQDLISHCQKSLGRSATISWVWVWYTKSFSENAANQYWHRDSSEPLNFRRIFIPLTPIREANEGPTQILENTEQLPLFAQPGARFQNEDLDSFDFFQPKHIFSSIGDVYDANTFSLHRGTQVTKKNYVRGMLSLLVSLAPSHRSCSLPKRKVSSFELDIQIRIKANPRWVKHLVHWDI